MAALTAEDGRRNAAAEDDPLLLIGPDVIHYAELLIRFHDHPVMSEGYEFWGHLADYLNRVMHLPGRPVRQYPGCWTEFSTAVAMASRYIERSPASRETKTALLRKFFPPPPPETAG